MRFKTFQYFVAALLTAAPALAIAPTEQWQAGTAVFTESGDYGSDQKTSTFYMPFSLRRLFEPGSVELVVPFISVTSAGQVVVVGGVPTGLGRRGRGGAGATGSTAATTTHSGLGDMILKGRYYALEETDWLPAVDAIAKVKFPTASHSDGLGTGKFDEGFDFEFTKTIQRRFLALGDLGYTFIGSPSDTDLNNQWNFSLGGGYYVIPEKLLVSMLYEESAALVTDESNPKDLLWEAQYTVTPRLSVEGGIQAGLSRSTADYGVNLGARLKF